MTARKNDYTKKLLRNCKSWGSPCTTQEELETVLLTKPDMQGRIVKMELTFYRHTHRVDIISRPDLFKLNGISHEERLEDFLILLTDNYRATGTIADLPTNEDVLNIIKGTENVTVVSHNIKVNDMYCPNLDKGSK